MSRKTNLEGKETWTKVLKVFTCEEEVAVDKEKSDDAHFGSQEYFEYLYNMKNEYTEEDSEYCTAFMMI